MKKNIREYKKLGVQFAYVLDCIYNDEKDNMSDKEAINYFFECFNAEYNSSYNRRICPNYQERITEYIKGLPSCFNADFCDFNIINIGKSWGYCKTDKQAAKFAYDWFNVLAYRLIQLREKLNN